MKTRTFKPIRPRLTPTRTEHPTRALLRYFGGKWAIAPWILSHLPPHRIYVEPFGGAASILLRKPRSKVEVYNDLDETIVGILRTVQDPRQCQLLMRRLRRTPYSRSEYERAFQGSVDPVVRAQRAVVRAYQSFHHESLFGLRKTCFASAKHKRGSSCKAHEWASYPRSLMAICRRLQGVVIECQPACEVIRTQDAPDTLFFIDPPYVPCTRSKSGYRHEMTEAEHVALLEQLRQVKGMVVLAGYPSKLYDSMLSDWQRLERPHRALASARPRTEVLWLSPHTVAKRSKSA